MCHLKLPYLYLSINQNHRKTVTSTFIVLITSLFLLCRDTAWNIISKGAVPDDFFRIIKETVLLDHRTCY
jgi:hypothetical protein